MAMVVVDDSSLQADSQPTSCGLVWGSAAAWRCSTFITWTKWTLAMTFKKTQRRLWTYTNRYVKQIITEFWYCIISTVTVQAYDKVGLPPVELGVSKSMECDIFPSVLWHCWLGDRKGIQPVKKLGVGLLVVMIWLELCTTIYSSSCHHHLHHPLLQ